MWKVIISLEVEESIESYIQSYKDHFNDLYRGGGIWAEDSLIETYRMSANILQENIYDRIDERCSSDILPFELLSNGNKKSVIFVRDRIIFLEYSEDHDEKIRSIEQIIIQYK